MLYLKPIHIYCVLPFLSACLFFDSSNISSTNNNETTSSNGTTTPNQAPTVTEVIIDENGGMVGDIFTGGYVYADSEKDPEARSTFRWLRNDEAIAGATTITYTLVAADQGTRLHFEVTPIAATGTQIGEPVLSQELLLAPPPTEFVLTLTNQSFPVHMDRR